MHRGHDARPAGRVYALPPESCRLRGNHRGRLRISPGLVILAPVFGLFPHGSLQALGVRTYAIPSRVFAHIVTVRSAVRTRDPIREPRNKTACFKVTCHCFLPIKWQQVRTIPCCRVPVLLSVPGNQQKTEGPQAPSVLLTLFLNVDVITPKVAIVPAL